MDCTEFLQLVLPRINRSWKGFRKVRRQVCSRIQKRIDGLDLNGYNEYSKYLEKHDEEWAMLDGFCQITISRFFRDRFVFEWMKTEAIPRIAKTRKMIRCWCIGAASGEEPYSLSIIFHEIAKTFKDIKWEIVATDINDQVLERAKEACYHASSLKEVSSERRDKAFDTAQELYCLKDKFKEKVVFLKQDIRSDAPDFIFDLVLCRNTVAIYFDHDQQVKIFRKVLDHMNEDSCIILGAHEELPEIFLDEGLVEKPVGSLPGYFKSH